MSGRQGRFFWKCLSICYIIYINIIYIIYIYINYIYHIYYYYNNIYIIIIYIIIIYLYCIIITISKRVALAGTEGGGGNKIPLL